MAHARFAPCREHFSRRPVSTQHSGSDREIRWSLAQSSRVLPRPIARAQRPAHARASSPPGRRGQSPGRPTMFEDSTFESNGRIRTRSRGWMFAALALNGSILAADPDSAHPPLRIAPPVRADLIEAPPPPAPPDQPAPQHPSQASQGGSPFNPITLQRPMLHPVGIPEEGDQPPTTTAAPTSSVRIPAPAFPLHRHFLPPQPAHRPPRPPRPRAPALFHGRRHAHSQDRSHLSISRRHRSSAGHRRPPGHHL